MTVVVTVFVERLTVATVVTVLPSMSVTCVSPCTPPLKPVSR
ncbi:MAG: hypothetical protein WDM96_17525 [Lacunisphaera sp.]